MNKEVSIIPLSYGNYVSLEDYMDLKKQLEEKDKETKTEKFLSYLIKQFNETQNTLYLDIIMIYEEIFEEGKDE